ncbi:MULTISPECIES: ABC transporter substrate-binding protein [Bradyrhizobium]|uniref:ABC transport system substrate-binding protein n=2 Tax=Bradyrhizobium TaxID=374 RepID=A0ABY0Q4M7_9BRAD|nr:MULTISPECIES: ABC transporter substrate-binding protein [Bradyrhizobium]SDJ51581.1 putative ABC transport system substrate-binding protein [Bradyrhizobium ottawaense]SEC48798.1 putative ABC transport system substrate-binding protein [Bradyrhizobium lablabi]
MAKPPGETRARASRRSPGHHVRLLGGRATAPALDAPAELPPPAVCASARGQLPSKRLNATGLAEAGWREGQIIFDVRWGGADADRIGAYATELVKLNPDVILATNTPTARSLKLATDAVPIVFAGLSDPVGDGASLSKPGRNITGFTSFNAPIAGKWLELVKELSPATNRIGVIYNPKTAPYSIFLPVMQEIAPKLGIAIEPMPVGDQAEIESAVAALAREPHAGLVALPDVFMTNNSKLIFALALQARLPTVGPLRFFAENGALVSYGSDFIGLFHQSASYVDRILRGEKPGELRVQEPTRYELILNLKTAKAMTLAVPQTVLARADDVIE